MKKFLITGSAHEVENLSDTIGYIEFLDNQVGKGMEELMKTGKYAIYPYGLGTKDKYGKLQNFELIGFNIGPTKR